MEDGCVLKGSRSCLPATTPTRRLCSSCPAWPMTMLMLMTRPRCSHLQPYHTRMDHCHIHYSSNSFQNKATHEVCITARMLSPCSLFLLVFFHRKIHAKALKEHVLEEDGRSILQLNMGNKLSIDSTGTAGEQQNIYRFSQQTRQTISRRAAAVAADRTHN